MFGQVWPRLANSSQISAESGSILAKCLHLLHNSAKVGRVWSMFDHVMPKSCPSRRCEVDVWLNLAKIRQGWPKNGPSRPVRPGRQIKRKADEMDLILGVPKRPGVRSKGMAQKHVLVVGKAQKRNGGGHEGR